MQGSWILAMETDPSGSIFAGGYGGVSISRDEGETWSPTDINLGSNLVYDLLQINQVLFAAGYPGGVCRSTDEGTHWTAVNTGLPSERTTCLATNNGGIIYCGTEGSGIYITTNQGDTWVAVNNGLLSLYIYSLCIDADGAVYAGARDGVYKSTDQGGTWVLSSNGLPGRIVDALLHVSGLLFASSSGAVYISSDDGSTWNRKGLNQLPSRVYNVLKVNAAGVIHAGGDLGVYTSSDFGENWQSISDGLPSGPVYDFVLDHQGKMFAATEGNGVFRSPPISSGQEVTIRTAPEGRKYTVDGQQYSNAHTFTWTVGSSHEISTTSPQQGSPGRRYVWTSWNSGAAIAHTYVVTSGPTLDLTANFDMEYSLTMIAGTGGTVSPGTSWHAPDTQLQILATAQTGYEFDRWEGSGPNAYSGTDNPVTITLSNALTENAFFRQTTDVRENSSIPSTMLLKQNAPNPCAAYTVFSFALPDARTVSLVVTDLLGRERARILDDRNLSVGEHRFVFDAAALGPGLYIYRLDANGEMRFGRMVVMR
jgi:photosystem II stability/assembly factor-like uncharacterized protein